MTELAFCSNRTKKGKFCSNKAIPDISGGLTQMSYYGAPSVQSRSLPFWFSTSCIFLIHQVLPVLLRILRNFWYQLKKYLHVRSYLLNNSSYNRKRLTGLPFNRTSLINFENPDSSHTCIQSRPVDQAIPEINEPFSIFPWIVRLTAHDCNCNTGITVIYILYYV